MLLNTIGSKIIFTWLVGAAVSKYTLLIQRESLHSFNHWSEGTFLETRNTPEYDQKQIEDLKERYNKKVEEEIKKLFWLL